MILVESCQDWQRAMPMPMENGEALGHAEGEALGLLWRASHSRTGRGLLWMASWTALNGVSWAWMLVCSTGPWSEDECMEDGGVHFSAFGNGIACRVCKT